MQTISSNEIFDWSWKINLHPISIIYGREYIEKKILRKRGKKIVYDAYMW